MAYPATHSRNGSPDSLSQVLSPYNPYLPKDPLEKSPNSHFTFLHDSPHTQDFCTLWGSVLECYSSPSHIQRVVLQASSILGSLPASVTLQGTELPVAPSYSWGNQDVDVFCKLQNNTQLGFKSGEAQLGSLPRASLRTASPKTTPLPTHSWWSIMVRTLLGVLGARLPGLKPQCHYFLVAWPWIRHLTSLCLFPPL